MRLSEKENAPPIHNSAARALHQALVDGLRRKGYLRSGPIEAAFRAVPRHLFVPGAPLQEAYSDQAIAIKTDATGNVLSASSQPPIMAIMLEQLDLRPGHKVLEIGAGTGYNAALMAHIVGETGQVLTLDIDQDLVDAAREHLAAAGLGRVQVVCADGGYGYADAAPYDRIIVTAGAWDITPSWWEQLRPGGRLLLPLAIKGEQKSVAFERRGDQLVSLSVRDCGFMVLRGAFADPQPRNVAQLGPDPGLELWSRGEYPPDATKVYHWLTGPSRDWDVDVTAAVHELISGLWLWLGLYEPHRGRIVAWDDMVERGIVPPLIGLGGPRKLVFALVLLGETGLAALTRPPDQRAPLVNVNDLYTPGPPFALFVRQFGTDEALAQRLIARIRAWDAAGRPSSEGMRIRAYPQASEHVPPKVEGEIRVEKRWTQLVLDWPQHAA
jgi:protein-L-isoaspartate(D-aspartate) O-methyltransferase